MIHNAAAFKMQRTQTVQRYPFSLWILLVTACNIWTGT